MAHRFKIFLKWTILVWLNAALSFYLSLSQYSQSIDVAGIIFGVFTFVIIYTTVDIYLLKLKNLKLRRQLFASVVIKSLFQIYPVVEISTGIISTGIVEDVIGKFIFVSAYLTTLTDGFLLSLLVAVIILLINFVANKLQTTNSARSL